MRQGNGGNSFEVTFAVGATLVSEIVGATDALSAACAALALHDRRSADVEWILVARRDVRVVTSPSQALRGVAA